MKAIEKCIVAKKYKGKVTCQFEEFQSYGGMPSSIKHQDDYYCVFHLPFDSPEKETHSNSLKLNSFLQGKNPQNNQTWTNYQFVMLTNTQNINIENFYTNGEIFDFSNTIIKSNVNINTNTATPIEIYAKNATFNGNLTVKVHIINLIDCENTDFYGICSISDANSIKKINFSNSKFHTNLSIRNNNVKTVINCDSNSFLRTYAKASTFYQVEFSGACIFDNVRLTEYINFTFCFLNNVSFINSHFGETGNKESLIKFHCFIGNLTFNHCNFYTPLSFSGKYVENFSGKTLKFVNNTKFHREAEFIWTEPKTTIKSLVFKHTKFTNNTVTIKLVLPKNLRTFKFDHSEVHSAISFDNSTLPKTSFHKNFFENKVSFNNTEFLEGVNFAKSTFKIAPSFFLATLHPNTVFPEMSAFEDYKSLESEKIYHDLYTKMAELKQREYEGMFYTLAQRCKRHKIKKWIGLKSLVKISLYKNWFLTMTSWLYDILCNFGTNYWRPFISLLIIWPSFALIDFLILKFFYIRKIQFIDTLNFSFQQMVRPFSIWGALSNLQLHNYQSPLPNFFRYIGASQSFLTLIILSLFIIALRWCFKRE